MENTLIEWAHHTFNPWSGCTRISPGCKHCYAATLAARFPSLGDWGPGAGRQRTSPANWRKVETWNRKAKAEGVSPRVFCASLGDWLDHEVPIEWLTDLLVLIAKTTSLTWLMLTKRPDNWHLRLVEAGKFMAMRMDDEDPVAIAMTSDWLNGSPPAHVWLGGSFEDQDQTERLEHLISIPAVLRFLSVEPMLGPVDFSGMRVRCGRCFVLSDFALGNGHDLLGPDPSHNGIQWVICGGESGKGARAMHPDWARSLRDQCVDAGVPFFFKQWGEWAPIHEGDRSPADVANDVTSIAYGTPVKRAWMQCVGKKVAGRLLDGEVWDQVPTRG